MKVMKKSKGFSLIELLIVVAIILIIAAIAIPNLLRARIAANESSAAASVRTIVTSQLAYQNAYQIFANSIMALGPPSATGCPSSGPTSANACILDYQLASTTATNPKSGYYFSAASPTTTQFFVQGHPGSAGTSGVKGFCATEDNAVRFNNPDAAIASHDACIALLPVIGN
jgi:prepilin-type N-terminal cleavage/methylation domain-containing protein